MKKNIRFEREVWQEILYWADKEQNSDLVEEAIRNLSSIADQDGISIVQYLRDRGSHIKLSQDWF